MTTPLDNMYDDVQTACTELYRETARLAADNVRLATAVKRLLAAVDFDVTPAGVWVSVQDARGAAEALRELQQLQELVQ